MREFEAARATSGAVMYMHQVDIARYPNATKLLQGLEGKLKGTQILDAYLDACTADDQKDARLARKIALQKGLKWAAGPMVSVHQGLIRAPVGGEIVDACGFLPTFSKKVDRVIVTSVWFDAYEFGSDFDRPKNAHRLTRTVLHETVHWVREVAGASDEIQVGGHYNGHLEEAGHYFETRAYGSANICTAAEIEDALFSIRTYPPKSP